MRIFLPHVFLRCNVLFCERTAGGEQPLKKRKLNDGSSTPSDAYLPDDVLWRQKEQFSDGVGYSWIDGLKAHANRTVTHNQLSWGYTVSSRIPTAVICKNKIWSRHT